MNNEQLTVTMPVKEYQRLKELEKVVNEYKKESCFIYQFDGHHHSSIDIINPQLMGSILGSKLVELQNELRANQIKIHNLNTEIEQINPPTLWQLLRKKLSL